jgi:hypothetical protein
VPAAGALPLRRPEGAVDQLEVGDGMSPSMTVIFHAPFDTIFNVNSPP